MPAAAAPTADPSAVIAAVEGAIPDWARSYNFGRRKVAVPVDGDAFVIPAVAVEAAEAALRALPDDVARRAGCHEGWRNQPLAGMLLEWGWAPDTDRRGDVSVVGIYGDVVFTEGFAALAALAPLISEGAMVFSGDDHGSENGPLFGVRARGGLLEVGRAERHVDYDLDF